MEAEPGITVAAYLRRLGLEDEAADRVLALGPSLEQLTEIYIKHLRTVAFENLNQHAHKAGETAPAIPNRTEEYSLSQAQFLQKIVGEGRGGFCFEINACFQWLLHQLGYRARLSLADVGCRGGVPSHIAILTSWEGSSDEYLVDPGFGDPARLALPLSALHDTFTDETGNEFQLVPGEEITLPETGAYHRLKADAEKPTLVLMKRSAAPAQERHRDWVDAPPEVPAAPEFRPMYRFAVEDDLPIDCEECQAGLHHVLTLDSIFFTQKRLVVVATEGGHVALCNNRVKFVQAGAETREEPFETEDQWRDALKTHFSMELQP